MLTAYHYNEDGKTWLRIRNEDGYEFEEPITGWELILDLTDGSSYYRHRDGRHYGAA